MAELIETRELCVGYHGIAVVRDINLYLRAGEVVALLGSNGAGKTTTLLTLSALIAPLKGHVTILGGPLEAPARAHRLVRRGLSHVPEDRALFRRLTVRQHLQLVQRRADQGMERSIWQMFPVLEPLKNRPAGVLSGGEQQMLALARALMSRPRALLIDEMSLGLAPLVVTHLLATVRHLADQQGLGVILVEQHVELALRSADRAYVVAHGRVSESQSAVDVLRDKRALEESYLGSNLTPTAPQT